MTVPDPKLARLIERLNEQLVFAVRERRHHLAEALADAIAALAGEKS